MNKKLIAVAVASTLAAPVVANADGHEGVTVYGRINNAIDINDSDIDLSSVSSRFGIRANADIGNGLSAFGRYEFATVTDREQNNIADLRLGFVGISGGFGSISVGNQWSAYFNTFGTIVSPTYSLGYFLYSSVAGGPFRASNTIKYANSFGPVSLEIDVRLNDSDEQGDVAEKINGNGGAIGLSISPTDNFTIAAAFDTEEDEGAEDTDRFGIGLTLGLGPVQLNLGHQNMEQGSVDVDHTQFYISASAGSTNFLLGFGSADTGTTEPSSVVAGVYHNLGGGLKIFAEHTTVDNDNNTDDTVITYLGMRIDF